MNGRGWLGTLLTPLYGAILVAAVALFPDQHGECVAGGAGITMRIEPAAALGADAAPLAQQQGAAEQVGPDFHPVEPPFVLVRPDAGEAGLVGKEGELQRFGHEACSGHWGAIARELYHAGCRGTRAIGQECQEKCGFLRRAAGRGSGSACYTIAHWVMASIEETKDNTPFNPVTNRGT